MMSRLMLNLHEATYVGLYTTRASIDMSYETHETDLVELDTIWSDAALDLSMSSQYRADEMQTRNSGSP